MRCTSLGLAMLLAIPHGSGEAAAQDLQTSNDWATGSAHAAVIDSINRENVKRLRGKTTRRTQAPPVRSRAEGPKWTPAERARNCAIVRRHLAKLDAKQLRAYRTVCR